MKRFHRSQPSAEEKRKSGGSGGLSSAQSDVEAPQPIAEQRKIYFNIPLPDEAKDEEGHPRVDFGRNKIRTTKYTPLTFLPKNLYLQFHNIANVYFFFIIILSIFPIFGASNPGLSAVPLIVILTVTAVKDAIEDWRRAVLDNELNNSPAYRLVDWHNVNSSEDHISLWRRVKKASTRGVTSLWRVFKGRKGKKSGKGKVYAERAVDEPTDRFSVDTRPEASSVYSRGTSFHSTHSQQDGGGIQMTPVPSPSPAYNENSTQDINAQFYYDGTNGAVSQDQPANPDKRAKASPRYYGSIIDHSKQTPEKARFKKDYWKNIEVGDFVRIYNDEPIPADIVILSTSDNDGACYIETKNLDGETNLKVRHALQSGRKVKHAKDCEKTEFIIESEAAQPNLYSYSGVIRWKERDVNKPEAPFREMVEPISISNMLLRGSSLKNTEWALGVVAFTGLETKIMLNSGITKSKRARLARELNWNVIYNFIILFFMCLISGTVQGCTWAEGDNSLDFFEFGSIGGTPALDGFITFWTGMVLFQNLVPISLYITLEIIRLFQAFFIYSDTFMYYQKLDYPCTPKSWNISDDLGQIEYIFSDKTGTLTQNVMEFRKCTINGVPYGEAYTEALAGMQRRQGINVEEEGPKAKAQIARDRITMLEKLRKLHDNPYLHDDELTFVAPDFVADLSGESGQEQKQANEFFMVALAICHTVITERTPGDPPKIEFRAQSPDEAALVATARDCGFTALGRVGDHLHVNVLGEEREYEVLETLEFNSTRKRMSALVRMPDGRIALFCKGADSVIYSRLKRGEQPRLRKSTAEQLEVFAREGLRTLCIAYKYIDEEEFQAWREKNEMASAAISEREEKLEECADAIERDLTLVGGTAIEDRLQDGVPDTIALLGDAGIKLWVLTGDKVETAINIGFSCNLLSNDMDLIVFSVDEDMPESAAAELDKYLKIFDITGSDEELEAARKNHEPPAPTHAVVIDGDALKLVLADELRQKFLLLCKQCRSVLCCRVSPAQKAAVVHLVKTSLDVMTLSVGDGANDVAMIQEADVGVGIAGEEGRQAVMSSDYAIGQFRFLQRLVLVHGRWSYRRLAETIANFFYKNMVWTFALFWYQIYNNFDGSYLFDYTYILLYNLAFTSLPVILMGVLDQDVSDKVSLAVPQLYRRGIERLEWSQKKFWLYMLDGIYQSLICFFMAYLIFNPATFETLNGRGVDDRPRMGVYVATAAVVVVNLYVLLNTYRWDWLMLLIVGISILLIWFWTGIYSSFTVSFQFYKAAAEVYDQLSFWTLTLLVVIICLLPRFTVKFVQKNYFPLDVDIVREQVRQGKFNHLDNYEAYVPPAAGVNKSFTASEMPTAMGTQPTINIPDDERPIYPPSESATRNTHNRSQNSSNETDYSAPTELPMRPSVDRAKPSFDRMRTSMDRIRPSFEASNDFTSAALLTRMESSHSQGPTHSPITPVQSRRRYDITSDLQ